MFVPLSQQILRTDISGMPLEWIDFQEAVRLHYTDKIAYASGSDRLRVRGGYNSATGRRTVLTLSSIIATRGRNRRLHEAYTPPLNNQTLFKRDGWLCLYCGEEFARAALSRDQSDGGGEEAPHRGVDPGCHREVGGICVRLKSNIIPKESC